MNALYYTPFKQLTCQICGYFREYAREIALIRSPFTAQNAAKYCSATGLRPDPLG